MTPAIGATFAAIATAGLVGALASTSPPPALAGPATPHAGALARLGRSRPARRLASAAGAMPTPLTERVDGIRVLVVGAVAATTCVLPMPLPLLGIPLALVAARAPVIASSRSARRRRADAVREVPLLLDLLAVATSAGLAPQLAVRHAVAHLRGPLGDELRTAIGATDLGRRWRDELEAAADRVGDPDLRRGVALLRRTESYGTSLADEVSRLAADVRLERRARAAERARTAPVKMLFPLVFLILPAFLLLTVVPVLLTTVRSI